jgi:hypothetical protein
MALAWSSPDAAAAAAATAAVAPADVEAEKPKPPPVRRIYEVTDLVSMPAFGPEVAPGVLPPDRLPGRRERSSAGGGYLMGGGGIGTAGGRIGPEGAPESTRERVDRLIKLIQDFVATADWLENGGADGRIVAYGTRLVVSAPPAMQAEVGRLLADLRLHELRPVRLRVTWAALSDDELAAVTTATAGAAQAATKGEKAAAAPGGVGRPYRTVDLAAVEKTKGAVRHRAELNAISGRRAGAAAGRVRNALRELDGVVGSGSAALEPTIDLVLAGAAIDVLPVLSDDGAAVTLELRGSIGRWDAPDAPPIRIPPPVATTRPTVNGTGATPAGAPDAGAGVPAEIDRLNLPVHALTATVRIPTGRAVVVGGIDGGADKDDPRPVYLIVEVWRDGLAEGAGKR